MKIRKVCMIVGGTLLIIGIFAPKVIFDTAAEFAKVTSMIEESLAKDLE